MIIPASGQEPAPVEPSVVVVPTLDTEVQPGKVVAWSAAMPTMWRELCDYLGADKIVLTPESKLANDLNPWKQDPAVILPKNGYLVLSGNGTKASVQAARDQLKQKFDREWPELDELPKKPSPEDWWFAFCMLKQTLQFEPAFLPQRDWAMLFKDGLGNEHAIKCFGTPADWADKFSGVVQVLRYQSPNTIIAIQTNVPGERLYLCTRVPLENKKYITSMAQTAEDIQRAKTALNARIAGGDKTAGHFGNGDLLEIPEVHFSGETNHLGDLKGSFQVPGKVPSQRFTHASHAVEFDMDETGVKIVGFGKGIGVGGVLPKPAHLRAFVFDEPFFVVAWRDEAPLPYFVAYVDGERAFKPSSGYTGDGLPLPPRYKSRCSMAERLLALKEYGGTQEQERMAGRGLDYLKTLQNPDGSWGDTSSLETTSLALLSYIAHCDTADSPFYGDAIMKGYLWMAEQLKNSPPEKRSLKETALATQALGEMIVLSRIGGKRIPGLTEVFDSYVKNVIDRQLPNGTWGAEDEEGYLITGHCIEALVSAKFTSIKIENLNTAWTRTRKYFMETSPPQNLAPEVAILRAAIAVNAYGSRSTFAEPANSETKAVVKRYRDLATAAKFLWSETTSLEHWLLFPTATSRYPDLTKALMQGAALDMIKAQEADGSIRSGPTMKTTPSISARDMALRRTIVAILTAGLPYRWRITPQEEGSLFDRR